MPSLKDLRLRINSVKSTQKITAAMKLVAGAKLRRAQEAALAARPYTERMERMVGSIGRAIANSPGAPKLLAGTGSDKVHLLVVLAVKVVQVAAVVQVQLVVAVMLLVHSVKVAQSHQRIASQSALNVKSSTT